MLRDAGLTARRSFHSGLRMITIKENAKIVGLSPSTVSIVLRGKAEKRGISPQTVEKIKRTAAEYGYVPNTPAIRLRLASNVTTYRVVIFWTADFRESVMLRFIKEIERRILNEKEMDFEVLLKVYKNDHLREAMTEELIRSCHGAIICNASAEDMAFVEDSHFSRPVVLYNRYSKKYPGVTLDDRRIGALPARAFGAHGCRRPSIITSPSTFSGMNLRWSAYEQTCAACGMEPPVKIVCGAGIHDGYLATRKLMEDHPDIDGVFYSSDELAMGGLRYFYEAGVPIPGQVKLIALGYNSLKNTELSIPALSVIDIPIERAAERCLTILTRLMRYEKADPSESESIISEYIPRESCPGV